MDNIKEKRATKGSHCLGWITVIHKTIAQLGQVCTCINIKCLGTWFCYLYSQV